MFDWVDWFRTHLRASADGFVWAFSRIDARDHFRIPPNQQALGEWSPARHVWHVTEYERWIALPSMQQWIDGQVPRPEAWKNDDVAWSAVKTISSDQLIAEFRKVRNQQIGLLDQLVAVDWEEPLETLWGPKPLSMIVTKTYQHTFEHGNTLLRMGLWWADLERKQAGL